MIAALFLSWWFWILFIECVALCVLVEFEEGYWGIASIVICFILLWYLDEVNILQIIANHWGKFAITALVYIPIGAGWGFAKWTLYVYGVKDKARDWLRLNKQLSEYKYDEKTEADRVSYLGLKGNEKPTLEKYLAYKMKLDIGDKLPPSIDDHKSDYVRWLSYWPFSFISTMLKDVLKKIARIIYENARVHLQRISDRIFKDMDIDGGN